MPRSLHVLIVEDAEHDALLLERALRSGGLDVTTRRVETESAMRDALLTSPWDVIISDYTLPGFSAYRAIETMRALNLDLPFIIVSGTVEEDTAVEAIRAGAHDFMSKGKFARLIPAIERELREAKVREERARMRHELLISDRMASIGTLAAGVAHEINNPLTAVVGGAELALEDCDRVLRELRDGPPSGERLPELIRALDEAMVNLQDVSEAADRVRLIVRDLKSFSRADDTTTGPVDIERAIETSTRMVQHELKHRARLLKSYRSVPPVLGNEARLGQIFMNLVINAAQAMPTQNIDRNEIHILTEATTEGRVLVEVRDNGPGIAPEMIPHIFDPFFTTKPIGTGTGLGLAICHRIVTEMGGSIEVKSAVGMGTTFQVGLPAFRGAAADSPTSAGRDVQLSAKVLVIDDSPNIGRVVAHMLERHHEVTVLSDAREGLSLLDAGVRFDVILCDLMMPLMSGMSFYAALEQRGLVGALRVAFMTGGAFTKEAQQFLARVPCEHIEKPMSSAALHALMGRLLAGSCPETLVNQAEVSKIDT